ncbi:Protein of unknown function (DUF952) [Geosmithia morbida]|uniref:DUF952 domain-containing protein n=1 Tax=Geosmithia morbida TaxID=1094350 RepID=A0A9P4Z1X1_9HYPO|nr:Protein of unknown function (DUF952) [Geosmithia morbida]KAF4125758.1 Protein of unknown function (DUF952) [Geosmithia morbida]
MSAEDPPKFLYKILPGSPPHPLPLELPLSELDQKDGFIHLSTSTQIPGTCDLFFGHTTDLWVLKIVFSKIETSIKWEGDGEIKFPHLYGRNFGLDEVVSSHNIVRNGTQKWSDNIKGSAWLE